MLKKILKVLGVILILLIAALFILPIVFKDQIIAKVKEEANKNLNAKIDFGDFDLSLIRSFPDFSFYIKDVKVDGVGEFEGVQMAGIAELNLSLDLMSVISGGEMNIKTIEIIEPNIHVIVTKEGKANYDIAKESEGGEEPEETTPEDTTASEFKMALKKFLIQKANIIYDDRQGNMYAEIKNLDFSLSGDFTADFTSLNTKTDIEALTYKMDGIPYLNETEIEIKADVDADLANSKYTFKDNEFRLNELTLGLNGWLALTGEESMDMDLTFEAKKTEFKNILSLIPAVYSKEFASVQTSGKLALNGFAKGTMVGETYPAFGVKLTIQDAMFKYPDLPKSVDNIQVAVDVNSSGGDLDNTIVDVSTFHMEMAGNPFDIALYLKTPMSDPFIRASFDGTLVLSSVKDVIPLEQGDELSGTITTDIHLEGNQSTIDNEQYENFKAEGSLLVANLTYKSNELPYTVVINKMDMGFSPQFVALNAFDSKVGRSDFVATGRLENFIPYALDDSATLKGVLNVTSQMLDLTEFMEEEEPAPAEGTATSGEPAEEEPMEVVEIPGNIDFELTSNFAAIHMDSLDMTNLVGKIVIRNQKMTIENTGLSMLGGSMTANGFYETTNAKAPTFDFDFAINKFDVPQTITTFNTVQEMAPLFKGATGQYSTSLKIAGTLNDKMEPDYPTLNGNGTLQTHDVEVKSFKALTQIADKLKKDELKQINMQNVNITYEIKEGKVFLKPFDVKVGNINTTISGWNSFDQTLEYNMDIAIPRSEFGGAANQAAEQALGSLLGKMGMDGQIKLPDIIKMRAQITGTADDPKVSMAMAGTEGGDSGSSAKDKLKDELDKKKKEAEEKARAEAERLKKEAEAKAKAAEDEARRKAEEARKKAQEEADKKKREAEQKAKEEAEKAKKKAEEDAKKKLKGVFK